MWKAIILDGKRIDGRRGCYFEVNDNSFVFAFASLHLAMARNPTQRGRSGVAAAQGRGYDNRLPIWRPRRSMASRQYQVTTAGGKFKIGFGFSFA